VIARLDTIEVRKCVFAELVRAFGDNFDHAGVGSVIALPR
jgi:hypothetical protein